MGCDFTIHVGKPKFNILTEIECDINTKEAFKQPHIMIGECSFLKAMLFEDPETFVPKPIMELSKIIPQACKGTIIITEDLIEKIKQIDWVNHTRYELYTTKEKLIEFLEHHKGKPCYYICW